MKALYLTGKAQVEMREVPVPQCPDDGLLIKIDSVGLCGSDVRTYSVGSAKISYPVVLGHENAGYRDEQNRRQEQPANTVNGNQKSFGHLKGAKTIAR